MYKKLGLEFDFTQKNSGIKDKIKFYESISKVKQIEYKHSAPLVVDERLRDLEYVLSIEKFREKYIAERNIRIQLQSQIKLLFKDEKRDDCLVPSEILKHAKEPEENPKMPYNKYCI
ncbi:hypothetical protein H312_03447 [Anncaliia algerae PRA339]|uniref:Uncharacterized protein n=1 Tax=Anncaliia algerae PRA339 TaxID=1288291 RepID=A0A059EWT4_9MICR|nr:hypothetical protein H312_03447 [Anncaliia algerae PRA339]